jgi:hypothetical protein
MLDATCSYRECPELQPNWHQGSRASSRISQQVDAAASRLVGRTEVLSLKESRYRARCTGMLHLQACVPQRPELRVRFLEYVPPGEIDKFLWVLPACLVKLA